MDQQLGQHLDRQRPGERELRLDDGRQRHDSAVGANNYNGGTTIQAGTLLIGSASALGSASVVLGNSSGTSAASLIMGGAFTVTNPVSVASGSSGPLTLGGGTDNNSTFSGAITVNNNLTVSQVSNTGSNALSLTGGISSGGGTQTVTFAGPGNINVSNNSISDGSGAVAVVVSGGVITFSTANTFSGGLTINDGMLISATSGGSTALGIGNVTVNSGGTLQGNAGDSFGYGSGSSPALITIAGGTVTSGTNGSYRITLPNITFSGGGTLTSGAGNNGDSGGNFSLFAQGASSATVSVINPGATTALVRAGSVAVQAGAVDFDVARGTATSDLTISASLTDWMSNGATLTKNGAGIMTLSGASTYSGTTTISGGTLTLSGSLAAANASFTNVSVGSSGTFNVTSTATLGSAGAPATLTNNGATTFSNAAQSLATLNGTSGTASLALNGTTLSISGGGAFAGAITNGTSGTGSLAVTGSTLTLSGASTYSGATNVQNNGTLVLSGTSAALGTTAVTVASGATFSAQPGSGSNTLAGSLTLSDGSNFNMTDGSIGTFKITGSGTALSVGSSTGAALTFELGSGNAGTDTIAVTNGTVAVGSVAGTVTISPLTLTSLVPGNYNLITAPAGGFAGSGPNNFTLLTTSLIAGGNSYALTLNNSTTTDEVLTITANAPTAAYWGGAEGDGVWKTQNPGTNWLNGPAGSDTYQLPGATTTVYFTANTAAGPTTTTLGQDFSIAGLQFTGSGTAAGSSSYTIGSANTLTIGVGGITLASTAAAQTISTAVTLGGPQNWTNNSSNTLTVSGAVGGSGSANLTLNGTGTVILSSASGNTYAGSTTISSGVLQLGSALAVQNSTLAVNVNNGLTFGSVVGGTFTVGGLAGSGNVALTDLVANPVTLQVGNNGTSNTYAGNLSGNGGLTVLGGTQVLSGGNTYNGTTTVSGSGTLTLADGSLAAASASFTNVSVGSSGTFNVDAGVTLGSLSAPVTLTDNGATTFSNGTQSLATLNGTSGTASLALQNSTALTVSGGGAFAGAITDGGSGAGSLTVTGSTLTLSGASTYSGGTNVQNGTLILTGSLASTGAVTLGNSGTSGLFQLGSGSSSVNQTVASLTTSGSGHANAVVGGASALSTLTVNNSSPDSYSGVLGGSGTNQNNLALTLSGDGTLTLGGANTYSGPTAVTGGGTLQNGVNNALPTGTVLTLSNSSSYDLAGFSQTIAALNDDGTTSNVVTNSGAGGSNLLTLSGTNSSSNPVNSTFAGTIQDGSATTALTVNAPSTVTVTLSGASTYSGTTTISGGTLTLSGSLAAANASFTNVSVGSSGTFNVTSTATLGSAGAPATLTNNGATTFSNAAQSLATLNGTSGTASLALNGTTLSISGGGAFAGAITNGTSGTGSLAVTGSTLTLSGASTYSGATNVQNNGTLVLSGTSAALGTTAVTVASGATFSAQPGSGSNTLAGSLTLSDGSNFNMTDGSIGTFKITGSGTALSVGSSTGTALTFELGSGNAGTDTIAVTNGTVAVGSVAGTVTISPLTLTSLVPGNYNLITAPAGGFAGSGPNNFTLLTTSLIAGGNSYALTLNNSTTTDEVLTITANAPTAAYWGGAEGDGVWKTQNPGTNWLNGPAGSDTYQLPGATTTVYFTANTAAGPTTTTLGQDFSIAGLQFTGSGTAAGSSSYTIGGETR